jgi:hypothetical protein
VKDKRHNCTPLEWALHAWSNPAPEARKDPYYEVIALLVTAGATVDSAWLNATRKSSLAENICTDPRMIAALKGAY